MDSGLFSENLQFECARCGYCCRHEPGYVFLSGDDLSRLAALKQTSEEDFINQYCRTVIFGWESRLSLREKANNDCIFWENDIGCSVYTARPLQCETYPFWPHILNSKFSWEEEQKKCPGIGKGRTYNRKEIESILSLREKTSMISIKDE